MSQRALGKILGDRPIAYHPLLAKMAGSVKAGILLSQLCYWQDRTTDPQGWFFKTREELQEETGLSREEQDAARRALKKLEITQEQRRGVPPKVHYKVDVERIQTLLEEMDQAQSNLRETHKLNGGKPTNQDVEKTQIDLRGTRITLGVKPTQRSEGNPQHIEETETTSESTQREPSRRSAASDGLRDPVWDGFVAEIRREPSTKRERDRWNGNVKQVRDALISDWSFDVPRELATSDPIYSRVRIEIRRRSRRWRERYPDAHLTDNALGLRWGELGEPATAPSIEDESARSKPSQISEDDRIRTSIAMARSRRGLGRPGLKSRLWTPVACPDCGEQLETYEAAATHPVHDLAEASGV